MERHILQSFKQVAFMIFCVRGHIRRHYAHIDPSRLGSRDMALGRLVDAVYVVERRKSTWSMVVYFSSSSGLYRTPCIECSFQFENSSDNPANAIQKAPDGGQRDISVGLVDEIQRRGD